MGGLNLNSTLAMTMGAGKGGGSPPPGYTTGAVAFDGATILTNAAVSSVTSSKWTISTWVYIPSSGAPEGAIDFIDFDPDNLEIDCWFYNTPITAPTFHRRIGINIQSTDGSKIFVIHTPPDVFEFDKWNHILAGQDAGYAAGLKTGFIYYNGVLQPNYFIVDTDVAFTYQFDGQKTVIPDTMADNPQLLGGYLADEWIAPGQYIDDVTKFRSVLTGKPIDLGANGETPTGTAPAIFARRAPFAAASTFATNLGTGGDFTITGGALAKAPSSPSD